MKKKMNYFLSQPRELFMGGKFCRIGIIPYFIFNNQRFYFLMTDAKHKELTDCGGIPKTDETWIHTAIRETDEESRGIFKFDSLDILNNGQIFWREDNRIAIIFINISSYIKSPFKALSLCYYYKFDYLRGIKKKESKDLLENSEMGFYSEDNLYNICCKTGKVYTPVKMLLLKFFRKKYNLKLNNNSIFENTKIKFPHRKPRLDRTKLEKLEERPLELLTLMISQ